MTVATPSVVRPGTAELDALITRIADGAFDREQNHVAPFEQVGWLKEAGFGALRIPVEHGGGGATSRELFETIIALSRADSNIGHLLRAHFGYTEDQILAEPSGQRDLWFARITGGDLIGNGNNELAHLHAGDFNKTTVFTPDGDDYLITGDKFYSTGSLYADHSFVTGVTPDGVPVSTAIALDSEGVTLEDDWDGFGQQLTATGTTRLREVRVSAADVVLPPEDLTQLGRWALGPFYQHYLNAVVAGNIWSVLDDAISLISGRTRSFTHGTADLPREDPVLLEVIGEISAHARASQSLVLEVADVLGAIEDAAPGAARDAAVHEAALRSSQAQIIVGDLGLRSATQLFEVGGASATRRSAALDRHWRNIRTVASHNPARFKARAIGELLVNGTELPNNTYF